MDKKRQLLQDRLQLKERREQMDYVMDLQQEESAPENVLLLLSHTVKIRARHLRVHCSFILRLRLLSLGPPPFLEIYKICKILAV